MLLRHDLKQRISYMRNILDVLKMAPSWHFWGKPFTRIFPRKANLLLFITNRCDSRCVMCNHWQQPVKYDLSLDIFEDLLRAKSVNKRGILIEGGETVLHPNIEAILELFKRNKIKNLVFLSNGILTKRLTELVKGFHISDVTISIDGTRDAYRRIRGVDAYDNAINSVLALKGRTNLSVCFTISKDNTVDDYLKIKQFCDENRIRLMMNIYSQYEYDFVANNEAEIDSFYDSLRNAYVSQYNRWARKEIKIPCFTMRYLAVIRPNGDVVICQCKPEIVLDNLHQKKFDEIWNDPKTIETQKRFRLCNDCWVASHRPFDIKLFLLMKKIFPGRLASKIIERI